MPNTPWRGSAAPNTPITLTLPYHTLKRVLTAVVRGAQRAHSKGVDPGGVAALAEASEVIGDALDAPPHRRFRLSTTLHHAVIAGTKEEYQQWCQTSPDAVDVTNLLYVDSVADALKARYRDYSTVGTWHNRIDALALLAAVKVRTFKRMEEKGALAAPR